MIWCVSEEVMKEAWEGGNSVVTIISVQNLEFSNRVCAWFTTKKKNTNRNQAWIVYKTMTT